MRPPTHRQREVLDHLRKRSAFSREEAQELPAFDEVPAEKLTQRGGVNKRYTMKGASYWIRGEDEAATGTQVPAGFVVILRRDLTTPMGRAENFFLARALYDGRGISFRRLLRGWQQTLGLRNKDLLDSSIAYELIAADNPVFNGDHVILDDL